jgi:hypothetical protein
MKTNTYYPGISPWPPPGYVSTPKGLEACSYPSGQPRSPQLPWRAQPRWAPQGPTTRSRASGSPSTRHQGRLAATDR